jgi:hypothetical protein
MNTKTQRKVISNLVDGRAVCDRINGILQAAGNPARALEGMYMGFSSKGGIDFTPGHVHIDTQMSKARLEAVGRCPVSRQFRVNGVFDKPAYRAAVDAWTTKAKAWHEPHINAAAELLRAQGIPVRLFVEYGFLKIDVPGRYK